METPSSPELEPDPYVAYPKVEVVNYYDNFGLGDVLGWGTEAEIQTTPPVVDDVDVLLTNSGQEPLL